MSEILDTFKVTMPNMETVFTTVIVYKLHINPLHMKTVVILTTLLNTRIEK